MRINFACRKKRAVVVFGCNHFATQKPIILFVIFRVFFFTINFYALHLQLLAYRNRILLTLNFIVLLQYVWYIGVMLLLITHRIVSLFANISPNPNDYHKINAINMKEIIMTRCSVIRKRCHSTSVTMCSWSNDLLLRKA